MMPLRRWQSLSNDTFFDGQRRQQIIVLATRQGCGFEERHMVNAGLMSYGPDPTKVFHRLGLYAGRILKGRSLPIRL
jgi:hypothetical protein